MNSEQDVEIGMWPEPATSGQHVGMPKGVKVTHKPTGIIVICDTERSQHANRQKALDFLARALEQQPEAKRDREADRQRFPDPGFNDWLDEVISDAGHIVWHQIGDLADAWAAWEARQYYGRAKAQGYPKCSGNPASCPENEGFGCCGSEQPEGREAVAWLYTLEYGGCVANTKVSKHQLHYPFGVCGSDYLARNDEGVSYVRETPLYTTPPAKVPEGWREALADAAEQFEADAKKLHMSVHGRKLSDKAKRLRAMLAAAPQPATKESRDE